MADGNLETLRRMVAAVDAGDAEAGRDLIDPEFEFAAHITGGVEGVKFRGLAGFESFIRMRGEAWESLHTELSEVRERGDLVVTLGTLRGRGEASGVEVEEPTVWVTRFREGRILHVESRSARDPAQVAWALAEAGLPADAFDPHGESGEAASLSD